MFKIILLVILGVVGFIAKVTDSYLVAGVSSIISTGLFLNIITTII